MQTDNEKYYSSARHDLISLIPPECQKILEVGCGAGTTGKVLKEKNKALELVGIEFVQPMAEKSKVFFDKVFCEDVQTFQLPYEREYFDCLIYGDVLEHLVDPWTVLKTHCEKLRSAGTVIVSIPNIGHYRIRKMLKKGLWQYENSGIMDRTHLRFFTKKSAIELLEQAGLKVTQINRIIGGSSTRKLCNRLLGGIWDDSLTDQYILVGEMQKTDRK